MGAVDGKHIRCMNPIGGGSNFFNYKKYYSVVLMAVADANLNVVAIDVGALGKDWDSSIFKDNILGLKLYSNTLNLPTPRDLPGTELKPKPFVMVGDEAFKIPPICYVHTQLGDWLHRNEYTTTDTAGVDAQWNVLLESWPTNGEYSIRPSLSNRSLLIVLSNVVVSYTI